MKIANVSGRDSISLLPIAASLPVQTTAPTTLWTQTPHAGYFINSVAVSASGGMVAAGTYFHNYGSTSTKSRRVGEPAPLASTIDPSEFGTFGTYVWDTAGTLVMSQEFQGWQGVFGVGLSADGGTVASCGWYQGAPTIDGFVAAYAVGTGATLLMYNPGARGNMVSLNQDGTVLLAAVDQGYLFVRSAGALFPTAPVTITLTDSTDEGMVAAVDASRQTGLLVSYHGEVIIFTIVAGTVGVLKRWQTPNSAYVHAAALTSDGTHAYVGANDGNLYSFEVASFLLEPASAWSTPIPGGATTIYGLATNLNGTLVGVAGNVASAGTGVVAVYGNKYREGALLWHDVTAHSPNGLGMDASGSYLGVADGHDTAGDLTLFEPLLSTQVWTLPTSEMCWPIVISANAQVVAAGCDNGVVYAFAGPDYGG